MTIEIEAKMRLVDDAAYDALAARLVELEAERGVHLLETNIFFDTGDKRLKSQDRGLRLRIEQPIESDTLTPVLDSEGKPAAPRCVITHKGPRAHGQLKSRRETEVGVDAPAAAEALLVQLGYQRMLSFEKRRQRWHYDAGSGRCRVELDELPHLGRYVEVEGPSEEAVLAVRDHLGLGDVPMITTSYIALLVAHLQQNRDSSAHITFPSVASV